MEVNAIIICVISLYLKYQWIEINAITIKVLYKYM